MQKLYFEPAWDKTIAPIDRERIINHFQSVQHLKDDIHLDFLREAVNHKNERLVTVLIHNRQDTPLQLEQAAIAYQTAQDTTKTSLFSLPLSIPTESSMPWTFIFSESNRTEQIPAYTIENLT